MSKPADSFFLWLLQVLILSLLLIFFLWLSIRPSPPSYAIRDFSVNTTSSISFTLEFSNENKGGDVFYNNINVSIYNADDSLVGATSLASFDQGHEKSTLVMGNVAAKAVGNRTLQLKMGLVAAVRYKIWWWRSKLHRVDVEAGVPVGVDGKISGKKKKIKMHKAQKKWRL